MTLLLMLCACNPDVFVVELGPSSNELKFGSDGGTGSITFHSGDWEIYRILLNGNITRGVVTRHGESMLQHDPSLDGIGEIRLDIGGKQCLISRKKKKRLEISMEDNAMSSDNALIIQIKNDLFHEELLITQDKADGYILDRIEWETTGAVCENILRSGWSMTVNNNGNEDIVMYKKVFEDCTGEANFTIDETSGYDWNKLSRYINNSKINIEIPVGIDDNGKFSFNGTIVPFGQDISYIEQDIPDLNQEMHFKPGLFRFTMIWEFRKLTTQYTLYLKSINGKNELRIHGTFTGYIPDLTTFHGIIEEVK